MFPGIIKEYPERVLLSINKHVQTKKIHYYIAGRHIVKLNQDLREECIIDRGYLIDAMNLTKDGLWIKYSSDSVQTHPVRYGYQEFIDIFKKGIEILPPIDLCVASATFHKKLCIAVDGPSFREKYLIIHNIETGESKKIPIEGGRVRTDGKHIFYRDYLSGTRCYDFDLNLIWEHNYQMEGSYSGPPEPMLYKDLVIINQGTKDWFRDKDHLTYGLGGKITAYAKSDGTPVWSREFKHCVICTPIDGILYSVHHGRILLIDAITGKILFESKPVVARPSSYDRVWSDGEYLFYISLYENKIIVLDRAGTILQELIIPKPYAPWPNHRTFQRFNDCYLLELAIGGRFKASYGLLILQTTQKKGPFDIRCERRPPHEIQCIDAPEGTQEYRITIEDKNIDNIVRYGNILLNECALFNGVHEWSNGEENKKFNGRIRLKVDMPNGQTHRSEIEKMLKIFEADRQRYLNFAGDGKTPIKTILEI